MTVGELLPEGGTVEPLRGGQLALISSQRSVIAPEIEDGDVIYQAVPLPSDLVKVLRLPRRAGPRTSVASLFMDLAEMAETRAGLVPAAARLWTAAVLATHLSGAIPVPVLNLWGGPGRTEAITRVYLSGVSLLELEIGILLLERRDLKQGAVLRVWMDKHVLPAFADRVLAIDTTVAQRCATLHVPKSRSDRDALIAATALVHGMTVATRNVSDFQAMGVATLDPWQS